MTVNFRRVLALALPALGVLAANPLYLLLDTAVIGRLGAGELAALAAGATVQSTVTTQLTFLSYGTTARSSRFYGADKTDRAIAEGVQATWVAVGVGVLLAMLVWLFAHPIALFLTNDPATADMAVSWMRVAALAIPLTLLVETIAINLKVDTEGETRGRTIGDETRLNDEEKTAKVAVGVDKQRFLEEFMRRLTDLAAKNA